MGDKQRKTLFVVCKSHRQLDSWCKGKDIQKVVPYTWRGGITTGGWRIWPCIVNGEGSGITDIAGLRGQHAIEFLGISEGSTYDAHTIMFALSRLRFTSEEWDEMEGGAVWGAS